VPTDGDIDVSAYTDYDLLAAADYIDANHYPENNRRLNAEIDRRGIRGKDIPSPQAAQDAQDRASSRDSASAFDQILNAAIAVILFALGFRGLVTNDLAVIGVQESQSEILHLHGMLAIVGGVQMILGGGLLLASLLVYARSGHRYTPLYIWLARLGRYAGVPLIFGGIFLRFL
jgi:hypothetical protein